MNNMMTVNLSNTLLASAIALGLGGSTLAMAQDQPVVNVATEPVLSRLR